MGDQLIAKITLLLLLHPLQMRALEAQLAALRSQAADVEERRKRLAQRQQQALDAANKARAGKGGAVFLSAAHYQVRTPSKEGISVSRRSCRVRPAFWCLGWEANCSDR